MTHDEIQQLTDSIGDMNIGELEGAYEVLRAWNKEAREKASAIEAGLLGPEEAMQFASTQDMVVRVLELKAQGKLPRVYAEALRLLDIQQAEGRSDFYSPTIEVDGRVTSNPMFMAFGSLLGVVRKLRARDELLAIARG